MRVCYWCYVLRAPVRQCAYHNACYVNVPRVYPLRVRECTRANIGQTNLVRVTPTSLLPMTATRPTARTDPPRPESRVRAYARVSSEVCEKRARTWVLPASCVCVSREART